MVADSLRTHLVTFWSVPEVIEDETDPRRPILRPADLVFTRGDGRPIHFATVLIFGGANVKTVQLAMGHTTPTVTRNTHVGYWPDAVDQTRTLVDSALGFTGVVPTDTR